MCINLDLPTKKFAFLFYRNFTWILSNFKLKQRLQKLCRVSTFTLFSSHFSTISWAKMIDEKFENRVKKKVIILLWKKVYPRSKRNIIKIFIFPELSSHLAKELTDAISISWILISTCNYFPVKSLGLAVVVWMLLHWREMDFFLLKLSGGDLEWWVKSLPHFYLWFNNHISRNLYQWNN